MGKFLFVLLVVLTWSGGCAGRWQRGWDASKYFDDREVIELCNSIQKDNVADVKRLLDKGVDPNANGDGQITPLAWALRHESLGSFRLLLQKGADPNVKLLRDFDHPFEKGSSVVHVVARAPFEYFELAFQHGGDPNLTGMKFDNSPLLTVIKHGGHRKLDRIKLLVDMGADVEYAGALEKSPLQTAITWGGQYDLALELLKSGADPLKYLPKQYSNAVHYAISEEQRRSAVWTPQQKSDHTDLMQHLLKLGCPIAEAKSDLDRWAAWGPMSPNEVKRKREEELKRLQAKQAMKNDL